MVLPDGTKLTILLNILNYHLTEIHRREEKETKLFEWSTALLIAVFAVVIALAPSSNLIGRPYLVKVIASLLAVLPTVIFAYCVLSERKSMSRQAQVVEKIQEKLNVFDEGVYVDNDALYPARWRNVFAANMLKRKTPLYYAATMLFMLFFVISSIWFFL